MTIEREHDEAWRELRSRLADHLVSMEPDEELGLAVDDGSGEVPAYVVVDVEVGGRLLLEAVGVGGLVEPWVPGDEYEDDDPVFHAELAQRECDLAAALVAGALRDQHGCLHPAFLLSRELDLDGLRWESRARTLPRARVLGDDAPLAVLVEDRDHLQRMVDATLAEMLDQPIAHDEDGDVPVPVGESVVWVQVLPDRPSVALFAILVDEVTDVDAAAREVSGLQARLPYLQVRATADSIVVRHEICAVPFAPRQLAGVLARLCSEIDDIAGEVAERVGGRRFLAGLGDGDEHDADVDEPLPGGLDEHLATVVELLLDGQVEPAQVAAAYDGQRTLLVRSLVGLRTGTVTVPGVDIDLLLHTVRSGLRHIVDQAARRDEGPTRPRGPRSQQLSLLPEDEPGLDLPGSERWVG
ncbi:hypothetical protein QWJ41_16655 [Nocardioides sp. SOB44]|uniref:Uncharacterized protein n=1 Tax=Nocardioides cremeus TaxID=3058044 RepID=A0ABT8TTT1_9ACTN|nr:hypothetical protein [Nocardioides cremeus]MDO3397358.1 hypothetical protein [Nocardioides cremeus]